MDSRKDFIALADWLYDGMSPNLPTTDTSEDKTELPK